MGTIELLKTVRSLENKDDYRPAMEDIRKRTLEQLANNQLGFTPDTELYKTINVLFDDSLSDKPLISLFEINSVTSLIGSNLLERFITRWNDTDKKYSEEFNQWSFSAHNFMNVSEGRFKALYDETEKMQNDRIERFKKGY